ncbi:MAG: coniferyl aldehyde dehydrogenase [Polaromonas sp. 24-62-144]|jgi:coniferyl-aldehyde dehydrogenase|uniref:coniferyl aldehyde dehydrogenase n=1 Tax=Polaromonas sp. TaxID=1869339 RepID=UPI000BD95497|nr:coniferyl aldehyde dehydrogenase [Polaromonas sp.]OYY99447.1 MAG: coniferyl aldehyde dehydrogenase [Polaromonas sp. 28-63-22]OYZ76619.1 MAG: coniferyl aldehyde dehydrogenase [Polaromonas sp. 24-62-144]HQS32425.1 coniferyl aldehyde dehydrogenase [Polaromonas sp.]HQS91004.1 coniferyl aldehyde dehydrogenase [Polaromonas sp.]
MTPNTDSTTLHALFAAQHQASRAQIEVPLTLRRDRLLRMRTLINENGSALAQAVQADFGVRSPQLTEIADLFVLRTLMSHTLKSLARWMKPVKVSTPLYLQPAHAYLQRQPLGVVGVVSPWNYPVQLALGPVITALAAGNRVMLKPSELTPETSALMASLIEKAFAPDELCVVQGDGALAAEFSGLPFDHLFFTGSTAVGRIVARAAAANLTPTTLELGGKSPCIVDASCDLEAAAIKIAHGKLLNAGQTCIAPDYVMVPKGQEAAFGDAFARAVHTLFPAIEGNADYAAIISPRHHARLQAMLAAAEGEGARVQVIGRPAGAPAVSRQMPPALVFGAAAGSKLLDEEIFGPILPVLPYDSLDEAIAYINARPRPLALYWFGTDTHARDAVLARTVSGGVTINDTLMHIAHENLPFGGVGDSGWGSYHGEAGFLRLTQQKPVLVQSKWARGDLFYPPYGKRFDQVMGLLKRWL